MSDDFISLESEYGAKNHKPLDVVLSKGKGCTVYDLEGNNYFSQKLLQNIILKLSSAEQVKKEAKSTMDSFTKRELEVLEEICRGKSTTEIADALFISNRTVETHRANLLSKTNCSNTINLVLYAIKNKFVEV